MNRYETQSPAPADEPAPEASDVHALAESERRYRALFENMNAGFVLFEVVDATPEHPADLLIVAANRGFEATTGLRREAVVGHRLRDAVPGIEHDAFDWIGTYTRVALTGQALQFEQNSARLGAHYSVSAYQAAPRQCAVTFVDISERRRAETALRDSEARLRTILDGVDAYIYLKDTQGRYLFANAAVRQLWRAELDDIVGHGDEHFFDEATARNIRRNDQRVLEFGETVRADETNTVSHDGRRRSYISVKLPLRRADGSVYALCGISTDITERVDIEEQIRALNAGLEQRVAERTAELIAANQELDAFAYAVSHDLRAPLRAMSGFASIIKEEHGAALDSDALALLDEIDAAGARMGALIEGLLTVSRSTRGELQRVEVDVSALAEQGLAQLQRLEPQRSVRWSVEPGIFAYADSAMLDAVMQNLIGNAWKYTAATADASIRVYCDEGDGHSWICVADNGAGFDMRHAHRLFKPFQRLHRHDEFPGLGIGLATVHRIVHRHGGEVDAHGEPGAGATLRFTLPDPATR
ncbi:phytochrome-like protein cph1 [mine drainage metagenome]|uniref:histidine kinase n=1 Tax=mine drainage metagenome TaxID=410659 RepID=A0A1J5QHC3_9ZZZZ